MKMEYLLVPIDTNNSSINNNSKKKKPMKIVNSLNEENINQSVRNQNNTVEY